MKEFDGSDPYGDYLLRNAEKGSHVYTVLRHTSRSGMLRVIDLFMVVEGNIQHLNPSKMAKEWDKKNDGFRIHGCGMDMGFEMVYQLGLLYHGDGYYFKQRWM